MFLATAAKWPVSSESLTWSWPFNQWDQDSFYLVGGESFQEAFRPINDFVKLLEDLTVSRWPVRSEVFIALDFGFTKGLLGPSSNPSNQKGTIFGINHQPSIVYLFVLAERSIVLLNITLAHKFPGFFLNHSKGARLDSCELKLLKAEQSTYRQ